MAIMDHPEKHTIPVIRIRIAIVQLISEAVTDEIFRSLQSVLNLYNKRRRCTCLPYVYYNDKIT